MPHPSSIDPIAWIESIARVDPDRIWLTEQEGRSITYAKLEKLVAETAARLASIGVAAGDRLAMQTEKRAEALILYFACLWMGAVILPLNTGYTASEIDYFTADAEPILFVGEADAPHRPKHIRFETLDSLIALPAPPINPRPHFAPNALAAILYTSGTTGKPKGAMLTRRNLASNAATLVDAWAITAADVLIHALPIFHVHGLFVATNSITAAGGRMIFLPAFDPARTVALFPHATMLMGVPTVYTRLLCEPSLTREAAAPMRLFISGSAPLLAETHRAFEDLSGHAILERYGMTETGMNTSNPYDGARVAGTVGPPLPGVEIRITDSDDGAALAGAAIGMVEVRGPNVFAGYWRDPERTASDFRDGGWFITGDLGLIDNTGYLHIVGRGKDLIISGGLNIYPIEVEEHLDALPYVLESAVIGLPDPDFGEMVTAVIVLNGGESFNEHLVRAALGERLARYKLPKVFHILPALPRNAMGKVQKAALRKRFGRSL
jgi:malonyl-CoA/methylmalonyl-CoA synthetase